MSVGLHAQNQTFWESWKGEEGWHYGCQPQWGHGQICHRADEAAWHQAWAQGRYIWSQRVFTSLLLPRWSVSASCSACVTSSRFPWARPATASTSTSPTAQSTRSSRICRGNKSSFSNFQVRVSNSNWVSKCFEDVPGRMETSWPSWRRRKCCWGGSSGTASSRESCLSSPRETMFRSKVIHCFDEYLKAFHSNILQLHNTKYLLSKQSQYYNSIIIIQSIFIEISLFCLYWIFEINKFKEQKYLFTLH